MLKRRKLVPDDGVEVGPKKIKLSEDNLQISDIDSCSSSDTDSDSGGSEPDDEDVNGKSWSESDERETSDGAEATTSNPDDTSDDSSF